MKKIQGLGRAALFLAGGIAGATSVMSLVWVGGRPLLLSEEAGALSIAAAASALAARDGGVLRFRLPHRRGQVKRNTLLDRPVAGLVMHGFALGSAFYTFVHVSLVYLVFLVPVTSLMSYAQVLVLGVLFALGRSLPVFAGMFFGEPDADRLGATFMTRGLPVVRTASTVFLVAVAGWAWSLLLLRA